MTGNIDPSDTSPLYLQVAQDIRDKIGAGELAAGTQIPDSRTLCRLYAVSNTTIQKAMAALISEGTIRSWRGQGCYVVPQPVAASSSRRVLGCVLPSVSDPFFSLIARAAQQRATEENCQMIFAEAAHGVEEEIARVQLLGELGVSDFILASSGPSQRLRDSMRRLAQDDVLYVSLTDLENEAAPFVGIDPRRAGFLATEHLIQTGYERIGLVAGRQPARSREGGRHQDGYRQAMQQYRKAMHTAFQWECTAEIGPDDYQCGWEVGRRVAGTAVRPDALVVYSDMAAIGLMDALLERGVGIPEEIAVVGVDGIEEGSRTPVPLTTVRQPAQCIGSLAVDSLVRRRRGETVPVRQVLDPAVVVRCSSRAAGRSHRS